MPINIVLSMLHMSHLVEQVVQEGCQAQVTCALLLIQYLVEGNVSLKGKPCNYNAKNSIVKMQNNGFFPQK